MPAKTLATPPLTTALPLSGGPWLKFPTPGPKTCTGGSPMCEHAGVVQVVSGAGKLFFNRLLKLTETMPIS